MFQANKQSEQQLVVNKPNILDRPKKLSSAGGGGVGIYHLPVYHLPFYHLPVYHLQFTIYQFTTYQFTIYQFTIYQQFTSLPFTIYQWRTTTPTRRRRLAGPGPPQWTLGNSR